MHRTQTFRMLSISVAVLFLGMQAPAHALPKCVGADVNQWDGCVAGEVWDSGDRYEGEYISGERSGKGTYFVSNGDVYKGDFLAGERHGYGIYTWKSGEVHEGGYENGLKSGPAIHWWTDGAVFIGRYADDVRAGSGYYVFPDGKADLCDYNGNQVSRCRGTTINDVAPVLKSAFEALPDIERRKVQASLSSSGLYSFSVDGKWGRGTFVGLVAFSVRKFGHISVDSIERVEELLGVLSR